MRAQTLGDEGANHFSELHLQTGEGKVRIEEEPDTIAILEGKGKVVTTQEELKEEIYPSLQENGLRSEWQAERAILYLL